MTEFKIPYRETEDYIANSVALIALEKYKHSSSNLFSISDLGMWRRYYFTFNCK